MNDSEIHSRVQVYSRSISQAAGEVLAHYVTKEPPDLTDLMLYAISEKDWSDYPVLFRVSYGFKGDQKAAAVDRVAIGIHLVQQSTFVIDDILDASESRAGQPTLANFCGTPTAIVVGELLVHLGWKELIGGVSQIEGGGVSSGCLEVLSGLLPEIYVGQWRDLEASIEPCIRSYLRTINLTTAQFFRRVAHLGAILSGKHGPQLMAAKSFGSAYGMAVQIFDDVADLTLDASLTGKPRALDIRNKRRRLPLILATQGAGVVANEIRALLSEEHCDSQRIAELIHFSGAIERTESFGSRYLERARGHAEAIEDPQDRSILLYLCNDLEGSYHHLRHLSSFGQRAARISS